jgi:hypothetical protein
MNDQEILRKALNEIDSYRYRWIWTFGITAALSQGVWIVLTINAHRFTERQLILWSALAVALTVFGGVFLLVLLIFRMTHKLLQAIDIAVRPHEA